MFTCKEFDTLHPNRLYSLYGHHKPFWSEYILHYDMWTPNMGSSWNNQTIQISCMAMSMSSFASLGERIVHESLVLVCFWLSLEVHDSRGISAKIVTSKFVFPEDILPLNLAEIFCYKTSKRYGIAGNGSRQKKISYLFFSMVFVGDQSWGCQSILQFVNLYPTVSHVPAWNDRMIHKGISLKW